MRRRFREAAVAALLVSSAPAAVADVHYVDASLEPEAELLGHEFVDVDGDGTLELCLAQRVQTGERQLALHRIDAARVAPEPYRVVPILDDALAYGFADVRAEPGRELILLTRTGCWSFSLTREGYRGNAERLAATDLIFDVADPRDLPYWAYVEQVEAREGGDLVFLPGRESLSLWGPRDDATAAEPRAASYRMVADFPTRSGATVKRANTQGSGQPTEASGSQNGVEIQLGSGGMRMTASASTAVAPFIGEAKERSRVLLRSSRSYSAPALIDVDGDGLRDLLRLDDEGLHVHLATPDGLPATPTRVEALPAYLKGAKGKSESSGTPEPQDAPDSLDSPDTSDATGGATLRLADVDGDGDPDLIARKEQDSDGFENGKITLLVLVNDGTRLLPDKPHQVLRFEAAELRVEVADVDGDGRPDLFMRKFELPSMLETVTGLEFTLTHLLFLGKKGSAPFERKPALRQAETFDENTVQDAIANRHLSLDCDGDGVADLVEVDVEGRIAIRRLTLRSSFLGGKRWSLDEDPWKRFDVRGSLEALTVRDLNGDGLGDIVSPSDEALTILLSQRPGAKPGAKR